MGLKTLSSPTLYYPPLTPISFDRNRPPRKSSLRTHSHGQPLPPSVLPLAGRCEQSPAKRCGGLVTTAVASHWSQGPDGLVSWSLPRFGRCSWFSPITSSLLCLRYHVEVCCCEDGRGVLSGVIGRGLSSTGDRGDARLVASVHGLEPWYRQKGESWLQAAAVSTQPRDGP